VVVTFRRWPDTQLHRHPGHPAKVPVFCRLIAPHGHEHGAAGVSFARNRQCGTAESAVMTPTQILGSVLQLFGTVVSVVGLLWVLRVTRGRLAQLGGDAIERWNNLLKSIDRWITQPPAPTATVAASLQGNGETTAETQGFTNDTLPGEVYARVKSALTTPLANELASLRNHVDDLAATLRNEINDAVTAERKIDEALRNRDFIPTLIGLGFSVIGYLCQIFG